jgi:hypothetical protein
MSKKLKIIIGFIVFIVVGSIIGFNIYVNDYYRADESVHILKQSVELEVIDDYTILRSPIDSEIGVIFYPGAKVESISYLPLLNDLRNQGVNVVLVDMPYNLAFFNKNAADSVYDLLPGIKEWYISGHSLGGGMASAYASDNSEKVEGLILLGAYIYGEYSDQNALTIYGTFNSNLEEFIDYTENIYIIEGGNHAQFGNYGKQKGDPDATITSDAQQAITVAEIMKFINR